MGTEDVMLYMGAPLHKDVQSIVWTMENTTFETAAYPSCSAALGIRDVQNWIERESDLSKIRGFGDDWDGFQSSAPDPRIVDSAIVLLRNLREACTLRAPQRIALSPNGAIAMEWVDGSTLLRAEIEDPTEVEWMLVVPGKATEFTTESLVSQSTSPEAGRGQEWQPAPAKAVGAGA
jgi:hypothetical protein